ncbi:MFS transporter [Paenibacillus beijingensis]|uniref:MFS transporter n=1 Tax=Paenibacillus beijingensis TaxID=1126833 RepID=UPI000AEEB482
MSKIRIMLICDIIIAALTLAALAVPNITWLLPVLTLRTAMGVFHTPAQQALTRRTVRESELLQASSWNGLVNQSSKIAGPLLGAATLGAISPEACIILNAAARLLSFFLLLPLRTLAEPKAPEQRGQTDRTKFLEQWKEGWMFLLRAKIVLHTTLFGFFGLTAILMIDYQFPTLLREIAPADESLLGPLIAAIGAGAVGVMLVINRFGRIRYGWGLGGGYILIGAGIALLGSLKAGAEEALLLALGGLIGIGNGLYMLTHNVVLQKETPPEMIGRVFGIQNMITGIVMFAAPLAGGVLVRMTGAGSAFVCLGLATALIGFGGLILQAKLWPEDRHGAARRAQQPDTAKQHT